MESEKLLNGRVSSESAFDVIDLENQLKSRRSLRRRAGKWAFRSLIAFLTVWSVVNLSTKAYKTFHKPQRVSCACGSSFAEARTLGCRFDSLASAWLRPECIDEDLTAEFNRAGPNPDGSWNYYTDYEKTATYTLDQIAALADTGIAYYNTQAWHLAHCTFNWRKMIRSRWTGVTVEARSDNEEHAMHCEAMLKNDLPLEYVGTVSLITFDADWAGLKQQMHEKEMHEMHEMHKMHDMHDMHDMHEDKAMHQMDDMHDMHDMHGEMHGEMHGDMHGNMHGDMHADEAMHPNGAQMHDMHANGGEMHQMHQGQMHGDMHPSNDMHPNMHPDMHPDMHPNMHPSPNMHLEMHPDMHPNMHPDMHPNMHPSSDMHLEMHPNMHPNMHPEMHPNMHPESSDMHPSGNMHASGDMHPYTELS